jgi:hypothetical protein
MFSVKIKSYPYSRLWRPLGLWDLKDPTSSIQSAQRWRWSCRPYTPAALYSPEALFFFCFWCSFLLMQFWYKTALHVHKIKEMKIFIIFIRLTYLDCLFGLVVRVHGYRFRGPRFDSWRYQIFWEIVDLEQGPLRLVGTMKELLGRNISSSSPESRE